MGPDEPAHGPRRTASSLPLFCDFGMNSVGLNAGEIVAPSSDWTFTPCLGGNEQAFKDQDQDSPATSHSLAKQQKKQMDKIFSNI